MQLICKSERIIQTSVCYDAIEENSWTNWNNWISSKGDMYNYDLVMTVMCGPHIPSVFLNRKKTPPDYRFNHPHNSSTFTFIAGLLLGFTVLMSSCTLSSSHSRNSWASCWAFPLNWVAFFDTAFCNKQRGPEITMHARSKSGDV